MGADAAVLIAKAQFCKRWRISWAEYDAAAKLDIAVLERWGEALDRST